MSRRPRRSRLALAAAIPLALTLGVPTVASAAATAQPSSAPGQHIATHKWTATQEFAHGTQHGVRPAHGSLTITRPAGTHAYTDPFAVPAEARQYDYATWTSPVVTTDFGLDQLVASWNARTPAGTWVQIDMRGTTETGARTKWYTMGRWAADDPDAGGAIHRTSVPKQGDENGYVAVDTFVAANGHTLRNYQVKISLNRLHGSNATPTVDMVAAMASNVDVPDEVPVSPLGGAEGITLDVPTYSQEIHKGQYPQWDGGGSAWCSPTSTSMVLAYWHRGPTPQDYSWVDPSYADPWVDYAARNTYDYSYDGAGNWPFNTAYDGRYGLEGFVTRLRSLTEAEQFIKAGIPIVVAVDWSPGELDGAGYSTRPLGHLITIVGFTDNGDVVVNDPASHTIHSDDEVRTVYNRKQFENVWIPESDGIAYIVHPTNVPLPPHPTEANW